MLMHGGVNSGSQYYEVIHHRCIFRTRGRATAAGSSNGPLVALSTSRLDGHDLGAKPNVLHKTMFLGIFLGIALDGEAVLEVLGIRQSLVGKFVQIAGSLDGELGISRRPYATQSVGSLVQSDVHKVARFENARGSKARNSSANDADLGRHGSDQRIAGAGGGGHIAYEDAFGAAIWFAHTCCRHFVALFSFV